MNRLLAVARGDEPADLLLEGGRVINVFTGEIVEADVAVAGSRIAGLGPGYRAGETRRLDGAYLCPGFIDAHVHIESAMVPPREFAATVVPHGVTTAITDPHEIANVLGLEGIRFMCEDAGGAPMTVFTNASSCVPATDLATTGAVLGSTDLIELLRGGEVLGLAEVMDYPAVVAGRPHVLDKIRAFEGRPLDGHCPGLDGRELNAYVAAGLQSDHESTSADEARRKARLGMTVFIREGSVARDLEALLPLVNPSNARQFCFCTDDRQITDLLEQGSIDHVIRKAISLGMDPVTAIRLGTLNTAEHFRLRDRGGIAPGRLADLVVFRDLQDPRPEQVYVEGRLVARNGELVAEPAAPAHSPASTVRVDWSRVRLELRAEGRRVRVIGVVPDQLVTRNLTDDCKVENGLAVSDPARDLLKVAVIERHRATGRVGLGFAKGFGLKRGALAGTVAHDHHNLMALGVDDASMVTAARAVAEAGGGLAAAEGDRVLAVLPLPIAGLMSTHGRTRVADELRGLLAAATGLGAGLHDPFMALSFIGLEVIPSLKLTDRGLVDVDRMELVPLFLTD